MRNNNASGWQRFACGTMSAAQIVGGGALIYATGGWGATFGSSFISSGISGLTYTFTANTGEFNTDRYVGESAIGLATGFVTGGANVAGSSMIKQAGKEAFKSTTKKALAKGAVSAVSGAAGEVTSKVVKNHVRKDDPNFKPEKISASDIATGAAVGIAGAVAGKVGGKQLGKTAKKVLKPIAKTEDAQKMVAGGVSGAVAGGVVSGTKKMHDNYTKGESVTDGLASSVAVGAGIGAVSGVLSVKKKINKKNAKKTQDPNVSDTKNTKKVNAKKTSSSNTEKTTNAKETSSSNTKKTTNDCDLNKHNDAGKTNSSGLYSNDGGLNSSPPSFRDDYRHRFFSDHGGDIPDVGDDNLSNNQHDNLKSFTNEDKLYAELFGIEIGKQIAKDDIRYLMVQQAKDLLEKINDLNLKPEEQLEQINEINKLIKNASNLLDQNTLAFFRQSIIVNLKNSKMDHCFNDVNFSVDDLINVISGDNNNINVTEGPSLFKQQTNVDADNSTFNNCFNPKQGIFNINPK